MTESSEREHSRIQYPVGARPRLSVAGRVCDVLDLSERGVRFRLDEGMTLTVGDEVAGRVEFRRTGPVDISGTVLRIAGREAAARLDAGIPLRAIIEEQRYLREHPGGIGG